MVLLAVQLRPTVCAPTEAVRAEGGLGGAAGEPEPASISVCGLPAASSATLRLAMRMPVPVGMKATASVQLAVGASAKGVLVHEPPAVTTKSLGSVPVKDTPETFRGPVPLLAMVTNCAALVVPVCWLVKPSPAAGVR